MEKCYFLVIVILFFGTKVHGETNTSEYPTLQQEWPYCFEFTWFGPDYDNVTRYNGTCSDYLDETRADGIPCAAPIVISYDGTLPNMQYLWDKHKTSILCKRSINQRCIKYTYYYNNQISNITYMCGKVQHSSGGIINSGCYKQHLSEGYDTEVCVCKSSNGIYPPCNSSRVATATLIVWMITGISWILYKFI